MVQDEVNSAKAGEGLEEVPNMKPGNYIVWSILVTAFCCVPFGIPSIIYAVLTNISFQNKQYDAALRYSKWAKIWSWVSFGAGVLSVIVAAILGIVGYFLQQ